MKLRIDNTSRKFSRVSFRKIKRFGYHKAKFTAWSRPYPEPIESIETGLAKQWKYSPRFNTFEADTFIELTGRRAKDYRNAEEKTGTKHIPGVTVWHHVWREENGEYEIQLVDYELHRSTCPHAGGCKLWLLQHPDKKKYAYKESSGSPEVTITENLKKQNVRLKRIQKSRFSSYHTNHKMAGSNRMYRDIVLDYKFPERNNISNRRYATVGKKCQKYRKWGLDPYGNVILQDRSKRLYFCDHEEGSVIPLNLCDIT